MLFVNNDKTDKTMIKQNFRLIYHCALDSLSTLNNFMMKLMILTNAIFGVKYNVYLERSTYTVNQYFSTDQCMKI